MPASVDRVAAATRVRRIVRPDAHAAARLPGAERLDLAGGRPDLGAGPLGELGDAADVVDVGVGDEDRRTLAPDSRELEPQLASGRRPGRRRRPRRRRARAHDVAVRLVRPERKASTASAMQASVRRRFVFGSRACQRLYAKRSRKYVNGMKSRVERRGDAAPA